MAGQTPITYAELPDGRAEARGGCVLCVLPLGRPQCDKLALAYAQCQAVRAGLPLAAVYSLQLPSPGLPLAAHPYIGRLKVIERELAAAGIPLLTLIGPAPQWLAAAFRHLQPSSVIIGNANRAGQQPLRTLLTELTESLVISPPAMPVVSPTLRPHPVPWPGPVIGLDALVGLSGVCGID